MPGEVQLNMENSRKPSADSHRMMQVVNHLRAMIEGGSLKPGDRIPPERDFAHQLNISRATLRAGIGYLAALAAERGKEEHHAALAEEVAEMFAAVDNPIEYLGHDVIFHRITAQASGNPILAAIMETVTSSMYDKRR